MRQNSRSASLIAAFNGPRTRRFRVVFLSGCLLAAIGYWFLMHSSVTANSALRNSVEWPKTDFSNATIDLDEIMSGGPPKDGIPAVDDPKFVPVADAAQWLHPQEPVIALQSDAGQGRAYPLQILMWHEIVNDEFGGKPVSVTFCPLCNASIVFDRRVNGKLLDFGTTGRLRKSDMVMYDRQTETWWQQFSGKGIVGELAGVELERVPATIIAYADFSAAFPDGDVLSRETGHSRQYGANPYRGYDRIGNLPFLLSDPVDERLPAMERVINISNGDVHRIYPFSAFEQQSVINDEVNGQPVVVFSKAGTLSVLDKGSIADSREIPSAVAWSRLVGERELTFMLGGDAITDKETRTKWDLFGRALDGELKGAQLEPVDSGVHFAFAWLAFNPGSDIYRAPE